VFEICDAVWRGIGNVPASGMGLKKEFQAFDAAKKILLDQGSGEKISHSMFSDIILPLFDNPELARQDDGATLVMPEGKLAFSTDSYVVDPIFFPGEILGILLSTEPLMIFPCAGLSPFISQWDSYLKRVLQSRI
jgi:hypothetical protein